MPKYNEEVTQQTIKKYTTPAKVGVKMGVSGLPSIKIQEAKVTEVDGSVVGIREGRDLFKEIGPGNGNTRFDAINESTGAVVTSLTYAQLRHVLYGLYVHLAEEST